MKNQRILLPYLYALITIVCTFLVGQLILWFVPDNTNIWASVLFIFMNLLPMLVAFGFVQMSGEMSGIGQILKAAFSPHERRNAYFPWTLLQGGLEEVGWRWYLQTHISIKKSFVLKMLVISVIWFVWHFPIYRLPWITAGSSNYLIFFLMILGNTFTLGAVKELSRGSIPCILAHMLIDTAAVTMLVGSNLTKVALLVGVEIILSVILVGILGRRQKQQSQV